MSVAKVIVDVPANKRTDPLTIGFLHDYKHVIKQGMRVIVPFGPTKSARVCY